MAELNSEQKSKTRVTVTLDSETYERLRYWAQKHSISINTYLKESIEMHIRFDNKDYDLPELEIQRLNQLIDSITTLSANVKSLESITISGFDSLVQLTRGDTYLLEDSGE